MVFKLSYDFRHIKPSPNNRLLLQEQIFKHKESHAAIKRASSHPSLQSNHLQKNPTRVTKNLLTNYNTPVSYHGFLASELRKASWERESSPSSGDQSIAVFKEIYQIRWSESSHSKFRGSPKINNHILNLSAKCQ